MNITFTGTEGLAAAINLNASSNEYLIVENKLTCKLNDIGKNDKTNLKPILDEFTNKDLPIANDTIVISVKNKLLPTQAKDFISNPEMFMKNFHPKGESVSLNGIEIPKSKNRLYIMNALQKLLSDIAEIKNIELLIPNVKPNLKQISTALFGIENMNDNTIKKCLKPDNIKSGTRIIYESTSNLVRIIR